MATDGRRPAWLQWIVSAATENVGLKVTSLLIAMALYGMVHGAGDVQRAVQVSMIARLPPPATRRVLLTDLPDEVRITLRGSQSVMSSLRPDELGPMNVDLSDGRHSVIDLVPPPIRLPAGVDLVEVQPARIPLRWDELIERQVPVRAILVGAPAAGMRLHEPIEVSPANIRVTGPDEYVGSMATVRTDQLDISGLGAGRYERRVALDQPRNHVQYDFLGSVRVAFTIDREIIERRFERLTVTPVGAARVTVRPPLVTVTVRGDPQRVASLDAAEIVPTVEVGDLPVLRGSSRLAVRVSHLPVDVTLVSIDPTDVIVVPAR